MRISDWSSDVCSSDLSARAGYKFMRTTSLSQTKSARFLLKLADQSAEWRHVQNELQAGKKLVKLFYGLTSYSPLGPGDSHERVITAIFQAAGWDLTDERFLPLQGLDRKRHLRPSRH